jgi:hypothetical protein
MNFAEVAAPMLVVVTNAAAPYASNVLAGIDKVPPTDTERPPVPTITPPSVEVVAAGRE